MGDKDFNLSFKVIFLAAILFFLLFIFSKNFYDESDSSYYLDKNNLSNVVSDTVLTNKSGTDNKPIRKFSHLRFAKTPISWKISEKNACNDVQEKRIKWAFEIIEEKTNRTLSFVNNQSLGENDIGLFINCYKSDYLGHSTITGGEGGPLYNSETKEITRGEINLYYYDRRKYEFCDVYPDTEIHEILHSFGIAHIEKDNSIMNPSADTCRPMEDKISECLSYLYGFFPFSCDGIQFFDA